ncbi:hypothetical protein [Rhodococcus sp. IEGM 1379]|uniref:hypothetical protein n=1 Tax=Rhodococcus sp. IEGM 1379 TaxID=3047086 RepID=UPI0024B7C67A|nr:hypothetical protein [Rhodococcus sp. IEGM 1379]MDI9914604.1 hypothetical protein [Rhodococcus sp. IEGM 1379]
MKVDLQLNGRPEDGAARAKELVALGSDGLHVRGSARRGNREFDSMRDLIDRDMMNAIAVVGTPEECAAKIIARFGDHADRVCCYFPGYPVVDEHIAEMISALEADQ